MRVAFLGPIAARGMPAKGGVESGTLEIINCVEARGILTLRFPYPAPDRHQSVARKGVAYALGFPGLILRVLFSVRNFDLLHLTSLYRAYLYPELATVLLVRLLGRPVILHLRPGDWWMQYQRRSALYRFCFRRLVRLSSRVLVESESLLEPAGSLGCSPVLVPSFVLEEPHSRTDAPSASNFVIVYVGSLNDEKGLPVILEARRIMARDGISVSLHLYGDGDTRYLENLKTCWPDPDVHWHGEIAHDEVRSQFRRGHFFLFPTRFIGEGHANALNEAMAEGVVPVVSDHGANRWVVGSAGFVLPLAAGAENYARTVLDVWEKNRWPQHSEACTERIRAHYWSGVVVDRILNAYESACPGT